MYFGSVRFFKHLILETLILIIAASIFFTISLGAQNANYREMIDAMSRSQQLESFPLKPPLEKLDYQTLYPDMKTSPPQNFVYNENTAYLTFDDGPSAITLEILDVLDEYQVKATFFVTGKEDPTSMSIMKQIVDRGHAIGIHTYSHQYKDIYSSVDNYLTDFYKEYQLIYTATGVKADIFRFPGGSINGYNTGSYEEIIAEMSRRGFVYFDWNVSMQDSTSCANVSSITSASLSGMARYSRVILLGHDSSGKKEVAAALPLIIKTYQENGYLFDKLNKEVTPVFFSYVD